MKSSPNHNPPNYKPYLAIAVMFAIALSGIVLLSIFSPNTDLAVVITAVFAILTPTTLSLLALMKAQETHLSVNSRLDDLISNADRSARAEGVEQGRREANERTDELKEIAERRAKKPGL